MPSTLRNFLISFVIASIIFGIVAYFAVGIIDKNVLNPEKEVSKVIDDTNNTEDIGTGAEGKDNPSGKGRSVSILFAVNDYRPDIYTDYENAEDPVLFIPREKKLISLVWCMFNKDRNEFVVTPIPVSTVIDVSGVTMDIARAYNYTDISYISGKVSGFIGIGIDWYFDMSVPSFINIINFFEGVEYDVPRALTYLNREEDFDISLQKGSTVLDGNSSVAILRSGDYASEVERANTVADFTMNVIHSITGNYLNKVRYHSILTYLNEITTTDMTSEAVANDLDVIFSMSAMKLTFSAYPGEWKDGRFFPDKTLGNEQFDIYR